MIRYIYEKRFNFLFLIILTGMLTSLTSCKAEKAEDEFDTLFDGKSLNGWHLMNDAQFVVEEGVIKLNGGTGWLRSENQYSDFILKLEFRFMKPLQDGGVFLRTTLEGENWPEEFYEVQVENSERMAMIWGTEYDLNVELTQQVLKPDGEWNEYEIKVVGPKIEVMLNGQLVSSAEDMDNRTTGYIGLQGENGIHEYRNIRIKDLAE